MSTSAQGKRTFYIGLNMAGAISAGAYTAGVMDFLIDALDTWHASQEEQRRLYGEEYWRWTIPAHDVKIVVMSGASAGGMTAALAAAAVQKDFHPVRNQQAAPSDNLLYNAWVKEVDIRPLLGSNDLAAADAPVLSVLDSSIVDSIAAEALKPAGDQARPRDYVADGMKLILTLTNVRGIPYTIEKNNGWSNQESVANYYADQQQFEVLKPGTAGSATPTYDPLSPESPVNWDVLQQAAKATGAFPLMLAPRSMVRKAAEYNSRKFKISKSPAECRDGICICTEAKVQKPNWTLTDSDSLATWNIDGGVTNNSPFDCAHQEVMAQPGAPADGSEPRDAKQADRAVITIAPFPAEDRFDPDFKPDADLLHMALKLVDVAVSQSRFQGENIHLAQLEDVFSRFIIAPSTEIKGMKALACATLSAFGGFLAEEFRAHDYQLGRRNCQQFLRKYFVLPLDNVVMKDYIAEHDHDRQTLLANFPASLPDGTVALPIIPLLGELNNEIPEVAAKIDRSRLEQVIPLISSRLKLVISRMLDTNHAPWLTHAAFDTVWFFVRQKIEGKLHLYMAKALASDGLLD